MNVVLMTSNVTFVPKNYYDFLESLLERSAPLIKGVVFIDNIDLKLIKTIFGLWTLGCTGMARQLSENLLLNPIDARKRLLAKYKIPYIYSKSANFPEVAEFLKSLDADLVVNARTRSIFKKEILSLPRLGCINIHHGLLPEYRGTMCDLFSLSQGKPAGFSIHRMTEKLDDGTILKRKVVDGGTAKNYLEYLEKTGSVEGETLAEILEEIVMQDRLPEGEKNICESPFYFKTPNSRSQIRDLKSKGIVL